jgi:hypothetical protein
MFVDLCKVASSFETWFIFLQMFWVCILTRFCHLGVGKPWATMGNTFLRVGGSNPFQGSYLCFKYAWKKCAMQVGCL